MRLRTLLAVAVCAIVFVPSDSSAQSLNTIGSNLNAAAKDTLKCTPQRLFRGDTLTLNMSVPHGRQMAIIQPGGTFFFVVYAPQGKPTAARSLMDMKEFRNRRQLTLATETAKATPYEYGRDDRNELIFTKTGWYEVRVSENLQTDDGTPVAKCRVHYTHRRRP